MKYNFDKKIDRKGSNSIKYDRASVVFGTEDILPMWVADMDFATADFIISDIKKRLQHPILGYTMRSKEFNNAFIRWAKKRYDWEVENQWLEFSPGVVSALAVSILALTSEGDKIIIQPPVYHPFFETIKGNNRVLLENSLKKDNQGNYKMDFEHLKSIIDEKTKMIIISNPHNPVGRVWTVDELQELGQIALENDLIILSDDIHSDFVYKNFQYTPIASLSDEIAKRTITAMSPSKTFNIAGLSTSVIVIPNEEYKKKYANKMASMHLFLGNIFGAEALISAYNKGEEWLLQLLEYLEENIDYASEFIKKNISSVEVRKPQGTFLLWLDFSKTGLSHDEIKEKLIKEAKLGFNSGLEFGKQGEKFFRMNIATPRENIEYALERLEKVFG